MILSVAGGLLLVGLATIALGWRGRVIDDHPHCRGCGFDLFKLYPAAATCPECGRALHRHGAVRIGGRAKRRGVIAAGAVLLVRINFEEAETSAQTPPPDVWLGEWLFEGIALDADAEPEAVWWEQSHIDPPPTLVPAQVRTLTPDQAAQEPTAEPRP